MEAVVVPFSPAQNFHHVSVPCCPNPSDDDPFGLFYHHSSAPTSPSRASAIYAGFSTAATQASPTTLEWDGKLGDHTDAFDFTFNFSGHLEKGAIPTDLAAAGDLFKDGKIRAPKKPPPPVHHLLDVGDRRLVTSSPRPPKSPGQPGGGSGGGDRGEELDPFHKERVRGREMAPCFPSISSSRSRKGSRSLSPSRGDRGIRTLNSSPSPSPSTTTSISKGGGSKRWSALRNLLLFRSASEGRVIGRGSKDPLRKYTVLSSSSEGEDPKQPSFRSTANNGSNEIFSAHDAHYTANRVASEEMKKKNLLLRHGLFGYLKFNPVVHRGFNGHSFSHGRS